MNAPQRNKVLINLNAGAKLINFVITFCVIYDTREKGLLLKKKKRNKIKSVSLEDCVRRHIIKKREREDDDDK